LLDASGFDKLIQFLLANPNLEGVMFEGQLSQVQANRLFHILIGANPTGTAFIDANMACFPKGQFFKTLVSANSRVGANFSRRRQLFP
jgi:hypothetical protein